jgi:5'-nucleotidase
MLITFNMTFYNIFTLLKKQALILITNDDGISAPGISNLVNAMRGFGDLYVVAPDKPQSGMGHAITINSTLRIHSTKLHNVNAEYACSGTPVDCVKIAINKLLPRKPDLIVSGINHGSNLSINVIYSGTMSAAVEGSLEGIPSIGFSLCDFSIDADFSACAKYVQQISEEVIKNGLPDGVCLNVNFPKLHESEIKGIKVCRQAKANWEEELDERLDPSGKPYFWLTGKFRNFEEGNKDTDLWANDNAYVSVVPIQNDMTSHQNIVQIAKRIGNI